MKNRMDESDPRYADHFKQVVDSIRQKPAKERTMLSNQRWASSSPTMTPSKPENGLR